MANQNSAVSIFETRKENRLNVIVDHQISARAFNGVLCLTLLWGFLVNTLMVAYLALPLMEALAGVPSWIVLVGYFVCAFAGIFISVKSANPFVRFLGYNLLVIPIGVLLCIIIPGIPVAIVTKALLLTGLVTATMILLGLVRPSFFLGLGRTLFLSLLIGLIVEIVATLLFHYSGTMFDWFFVLIFSAYIGYDIAKAQIYPRTYDNAVDCALDIYLDIVNLFIRLLAILSKR